MGLAVGEVRQRLLPPPPDATVERVEADPVDEFGRALDVPDREIAGFSDLDRPGLIEPSERPGGVAGDGDHALLDGHAEQRRPHVHREQQRGERRRAGIAVGGERHGRAVTAEKIDRRELRFAEGVKGARQQDGHRPRRGHGRRAFVVGVFEVVGGERPEPRRECGSAGVRELVGMELDRQAMRSRRRKDAGNFRLGEPLAGHGGENHIANLVDKGGAVPVAREGMGAEIGGDHRDGAPAAELPRRPQHPELGVAVETVAGLDLDRGHAFREEVVEPGQGQANQRLFTCGAGGADGGEDAAAGRGDLLVGGALKPLLELARAVAREDEMGMAVDQARSDQPAFAVDGLARNDSGRQIGHPGLERDAAIDSADRGGLNQSEPFGGR